MADQFVQAVAGTEGTTTCSATLTGVGAGNSIVALLWAGNGAEPPTPQTVADGQGSYLAGTNSAVDTINTVWVRPFYLLAATAGAHVLTGTLASGQLGFIVAIEIQGNTYSGDSAFFNDTPGAGTDAITSGSVSISGAATLIGMAADTSTTSSSSEPTVGTGFTSRLNNANGTIGAYRLITGAASSSKAATWTAPVGSDRFVAVAIAILNSAPSTTGALTLAGMAPQRVLGTIITPQTA